MPLTLGPHIVHTVPTTSLLAPSFLADLVDGRREGTGSGLCGAPKPGPGAVHPHGAGGDAPL